MRFRNGIECLAFESEAIIDVIYVNYYLTIYYLYNRVFHNMWA